jgi:NAD(P)-dependent dehydrogenase (short-subunit alcohol dehydrogenase family)
MPNLLLIGATSGIGHAVKESLDSSWQQWAVSRHPPEASSARHATWDASRDPFPEEFLPEKLDGLVYCPGSIRLQPFPKLRDEDFRADFELNLLGAVRATRAALPALKAAGEASIVLFSTVAVSTGMPMHASVAAAKGAVEGFARSLAAELAPTVRVNVVAPSLTDTPLASGLLRSERQREAAGARHPLGRVGKPSDIAAAARFLLSRESAWVTGQVISVDGGLGTLRRFT